MMYTFKFQGESVIIGAESMELRHHVAIDIEDNYEVNDGLLLCEVNFMPPFEILFI